MPCRCPKGVIHGKCDQGSAVERNDYTEDYARRVAGCFSGVVISGHDSGSVREVVFCVRASERVSFALVGK